MKQVYFDCETTGPDASKDRIVQLAILLIDEKGKVLLNKSKLYNPGIPISKAAADTHGITDDMVVNKPSFKEDAKNLKKIFENSVLIGYNIMRFDIPLLVNEFERADVSLDLSDEVIDVMTLEAAINPRTLSSVYKRYTGKDLEGAHDATADVMGTKEVLDHQLAKIKSEKLDKDALLKAAGVPEGAADFFGKLKWLEDGKLAFNFGKHVGAAVLANSDTRQYANWIITQNFPSQVKKLLQEELKKDVANTFKKKSESNGFYQVTQKMVGQHVKTGKSFDQLNAIEIDDDLPF